MGESSQIPSHEKTHSREELSYEIRGIDEQGNRGDLYLYDTSVESIAKETGKSIPTIKGLRTMADLIPELSGIMDSRTIARDIAKEIEKYFEKSVTQPKRPHGATYRKSLMGLSGICLKIIYCKFI
jgi:hypothetical protein